MLVTKCCAIVILGCLEEMLLMQYAERECLPAQSTFSNARYKIFHLQNLLAPRSDPIEYAATLNSETSRKSPETTIPPVW